MKERIEQLRAYFQKSKEEMLTLGEDVLQWDSLLDLLTVISSDGINQDDIKELLNFFEKEQGKVKEVCLFGLYAATLHKVLDDGVLEARKDGISKRRKEILALDKLFGGAAE